MEKEPLLNEIKSVEISEKGIFKYILIEAKLEGHED
jgi:hypothetical protein